MSRIIVVGANHAGTAAINTILDNYKDSEVVVFERNTNVSFLGCGMALWIGDQIDGSDGLFYSNKEAMEKKGAKVYMQTEVTNIDFSGKTVTAKDANGAVITEAYDKLILATGSNPIIPNLPGSDLQNIQKVKLFQDAQTVIDKLCCSCIKKVSVIGAGYIGVELAEAFKRKGKETTLIDIAPTCLPTYYDTEFTDLMKKNLEDNGINLKFGVSVEGFEGIDGKLSKVLTSQGSVEADMAIWAVGFRPNTCLAKDKLECFKNGAYLVNLNQQTSEKDVYAIGDCATVKDNASGSTAYIALATNAVRSGIVAAHNACGVQLDSIGVQGSNAISIFGLHMISTGLTLAKAKAQGIDAACTDYEDLQRAAFMRTNEKTKIRIVFEKQSRRIIGAQLASKIDVSMGIHMFSLAIQEKLTIDKLKLLDIFFLPHFNQPYNYITMAALNAPNT